MDSQNVHTTLEGRLKIGLSSLYFAIGETEARKHTWADWGCLALCSRAQASLVALASRGPVCVPRSHTHLCSVHTDAQMHRPVLQIPAEPFMRRKHIPSVPSRNLPSEPGQWETEVPSGVGFVVGSCFPASMEEDEFKKKESTSQMCKLKH